MSHADLVGDCWYDAIERGRAIGSAIGGESNINIAGVAAGKEKSFSPLCARCSGQGLFHPDLL
jgi:hypothetical protein